MALGHVDISRTRPPVKEIQLAATAAPTGDGCCRGIKDPSGKRNTDLAVAQINVPKWPPW